MLPKIRLVKNEKVVHLDRKPVQTEDPTQQLLAKRDDAFRQQAVVILKDLFEKFPKT